MTNTEKNYEQSSTSDHQDVPLSLLSLTLDPYCQADRSQCRMREDVAAAIQFNSAFYHTKHKKEFFFINQHKTANCGKKT